MTTAPAGVTSPPLAADELARIRAAFPILTRRIADHPLVYLDSAATAQKPQVVLDAMDQFYRVSNGAVHRGAHTLAEESTSAFEASRARLARFFHVPARDHVVFTAGATAALNLVAYALLGATLDALGHAGSGGGGTASESRYVIRPGDNIVLTEAEHHANLVPWQQLARRTGAELRWVRLRPDGRLATSQVGELVDGRTKVVAFTLASNVTGAVTDAAAFVEAAREVGAIAVADGAQVAPALPLDFGALGADAVAVAGHKMYGPTGVGLLLARGELLDALPPFLTGGSMVEVVTPQETTFMAPPAKFEAGTQMVAEAVGLAAAADFLDDIGMDRVAAHEADLAAALLEGIGGVPGVRILGPTERAQRVASVSFVVDGVHPHDVGQVLDAAGVAVRVGHHCAQVTHRALGVHASTRASAGVYTTHQEIEALVAALGTVREFFQVDR